MEFGYDGEAVRFTLVDRVMQGWDMLCEAL